MRAVLLLVSKFDAGDKLRPTKIKNEPSTFLHVAAAFNSPDIASSLASHTSLAKGLHNRLNSLKILRVEKRSRAVKSFS
jgi:hypothetical protein